MHNDYYQKEIFLAQVDETDNIVQRVERWEAHEKGILHRGFTAILQYKNQILLQHRKHKAFDGYWDLTFSSHQIFKKGLLQKDTLAIYDALEREWNVSLENVVNIISKGKIYYKAKDPKSIYTEHEVDYIYLVQLTSLPKPNLEYAYSFETIESKQENIQNSLGQYLLAPWVEKMLTIKDLFSMSV
ncbi:NUDIX domain-containing protein [Candidatus Gottesmanbacteria bacterium]|nr:NUDIX domain-containing protein [Candidatus Gottesmanbacteria bacterium]